MPCQWFNSGCHCLWSSTWLYNPSTQPSWDLYDSLPVIALVAWPPPHQLPPTNSKHNFCHYHNQTGHLTWATWQAHDVGSTLLAWVSSQWVGMTPNSLQTLCHLPVIHMLMWLGHCSTDSMPTHDYCHSPTTCPGLTGEPVKGHQHWSMPVMVIGLASSSCGYAKFVSSIWTLFCIYLKLGIEFHIIILAGSWSHDFCAFFGTLKFFHIKRLKKYFANISSLAMFGMFVLAWPWLPDFSAFFRIFCTFSMYMVTCLPFCLIGHLANISKWGNYPL